VGFVVLVSVSDHEPRRRCSVHAGLVPSPPLLRLARELSADSRRERGFEVIFVTGGTSRQTLIPFELPPNICEAWVSKKKRRRRSRRHQVESRAQLKVCIR